MESMILEEAKIARPTHLSCERLIWCCSPIEIKTNNRNISSVGNYIDTERSIVWEYEVGMWESTLPSNVVLGFFVTQG